MAAEIPNLVKRNGIYYFRCRIPSILTNGRAREVKISLKTGNLTSRLLKKSCLSEKSLQVIRTADFFISTIHVGTTSAICRKKFR